MARKQDKISSDSVSYSYSCERTVGFTIGTEVVLRQIKLITNGIVTRPSINTYDSYIKVILFASDDNLEQKYGSTYQAIKAVIDLETSSGQNANLLSIGFVYDFSKMYNDAGLNPSLVYSILNSYMKPLNINAPTNSSTYEVESYILQNEINAILNTLPYNSTTTSSSKPTVALLFKINDLDKKTVLNKSEIFVSYKVNHEFTNATFSNSS